MIRVFPPVSRRYSEVRDEICNGDFLLWHPTSLIGRAICWATRQRFSHASMAVWDRSHERLYNAEMIQVCGGRHQPLSDQVKQYPASCEVWRPKLSTYDGDGAAFQMLLLMGQRYGWDDFLAIGIRSILPRITLPRPIDDNDPAVPKVCSASDRWAARTGGGFTPCADKPDLWVTPGDLADLQQMTCLFQLLPD